MIPIGWKKTAGGEWIPSYVWVRSGAEWLPRNGDSAIRAGGGWAEAATMDIPVLTLHPAGGNGGELPTPESVDDTGARLPMDQEDGALSLRVVTGTVTPGAVLRITGGNRCEFGIWHFTELTLESDSAYNILVPRGEFGPDSPTVTASSANVGVTAFYFPP